MPRVCQRKIEDNRELNLSGIFRERISRSPAARSHVWAHGVHVAVASTRAKRRLTTRAVSHGRNVSASVFPYSISLVSRKTRRGTEEKRDTSEETQFREAESAVSRIAKFRSLTCGEASD